MSAPRARWALTAALAAAISFPLTRDRGWDSYPISSFPMFARGDLGTRVALAHAVMIDGAGRRRPAPPSLVGTPEVMVAKNVVEHAIADGRANDLCVKIAAGAQRDVARIEIVTSVFDTERYFEDPTPLERTVHASCNVSR